MTENRQKSNAWNYNRGRFPPSGGGRMGSSGQQWSKQMVPGMCGLFFTAEDEKRAVREARNLIEKFIAEISEQTKAENEAGIANKSEDISDLLKGECANLQKPSNDNRRIVLQQAETGAKCTLFFISPSFTPDNVYVLAERMAESCQADQQNRFLAKVIPIEETCPAYMDQITPILTAMIKKHLAVHAGKSTLPPTFAIDFKARNTKLLDKQKVYDEMTALMKEQSPECSVNLTKPDMLIVVHAIRTIALLAIVRDFEKYRKYSLRKPVEEEQAKEGQTTTSKDETEEKEMEEGD